MFPAPSIGMVSHAEQSPGDLLLNALIPLEMIVH